MKYDADAAFIKMWLPELASLPPKEAHLSPFRTSSGGSRDGGDENCVGVAEVGACSGGGVLPPLVDPFTQLTWMDRQELFPEALATE